MALIGPNAAPDAAEDLSSRRVLRNQRRIGSSAWERG
jgi:hypothetical protein